MKVTIGIADNGWIVLGYDHDDVSASVFGMDSDDDAVPVFRDVLYEVNELIGPATTRYSKHRINIDVVQGDKY